MNNNDNNVAPLFDPTQFQAPQQNNQAPMFNPNSFQGQQEAPQQPQQNPFWQAIDAINTAGDKYLAPVGAGILSGVGGAGASLANLLPGVNIQHPNLKPFLKEKGSMQNLLYGGGQLAGDLMAFGGGYSALNKLAPYAKGVKGIGLEALKGGALGYGMGEEGLGGRAGGAALGTILGAATPMFPGKIADKLTRERSAQINKYSKGYEDLFQGLKDAGIDKVRPPNINTEPLKKFATKKELDSLNSFLKDPTVKGAHQAQSDMGRILRQLDSRKVSQGSLSGAEKKVQEAAKQTQKKLRGVLYENLSKSGQGQAKKYMDLTQGYKKDVVPYESLKPLQQFIRNELPKSKLPKKVAASDKFMTKKGSEYPELVMRNYPGVAKKYLPYLIAGGAGGYGGSKLF